MPQSSLIKVVFEEVMRWQRKIWVQLSLRDAYPNLFNPITTISFSLPEASQVILRVYDVQGQVVARLVNGWQDAGSHNVAFDGTNLASGIYVYRLTAGGFNATGKLILLK